MRMHKRAATAREGGLTSWAKRPRGLLAKMQCELCLGVGLHDDLLAGLAMPFMSCAGPEEANQFRVGIGVQGAQKIRRVNRKLPGQAVSY